MGGDPLHPARIGRPEALLDACARGYWADASAPW
jgi:hypothetical protein